MVFRENNSAFGDFKACVEWVGWLTPSDRRGDDFRAIHDLFDACP